MYNDNSISHLKYLSASLAPICSIVRKVPVAFPSHSTVVKWSCVLQLGAKLQLSFSGVPLTMSPCFIDTYKFKCVLSVNSEMLTWPLRHLYHGLWVEMTPNERNLFLASRSKWNSCHRWKRNAQKSTPSKTSMTLNRTELGKETCVVEY